MGIQTIFVPQPLSSSVSLHVCLFPLEKQKGRVPTSGLESPFCPTWGQKGRLHFPGRMTSSAKGPRASRGYLSHRRLALRREDRRPSFPHHWWVLSRQVPLSGRPWELSSQLLVPRGVRPPGHSIPGPVVPIPAGSNAPAPFPSTPQGPGRAVGTHRAASAAVPAPRTLLARSCLS